MENRRTARTHFAAALVFFGITSMAAIVLLLTAVMVWLTELTGSLITASLIAGGFFAFLSLVVYWLSIRDAIARIREQVETVYEVARIVRTGYEWVTEKILLFLNLQGK